MVEEKAMAMVQVAEVAEEVTTREPLADNEVLHWITKADAAIVELHTHQDSVLHMASHATTVVNPIITPGTGWSRLRSSTPGHRSWQDMHDMEPTEEFEYDTIHVVCKVTFSSSCYKNRNEQNDNVMFDEIADIAKCNLRVLSDLYVQSWSRKNVLRFKLDTGASGNMLPFDIWQEFFPGQSKFDLAHTIDKGVTLQAYNKSGICQLGTCNLQVSHNGVTHTCHFFVVPSQFHPILGLSDLLALNLISFDCPTTTSWSSSHTSAYIDTVTCDSIDNTANLTKPLTMTDIIDNPKYKPLFEGVGRF